MTDGVPKPCLTCGQLAIANRCEEHEALRARGTTRASYRERGYDASWDRLSRRARARQNFCSECLSTENLSADHTPQAWHRKLNGLPIRLRDVQVLCAACQARVGSSRPGSPRYDAWLAGR